MTKTYTKLWQYLLICLLFASGGAYPWQSAKAELLFSDDFNLADGTSLYNQNGWIKYGTNADDPIKVYQPGLTYPGYLETGGKVKLGTTKTAEDLMHFFAEDKMIKEGSVYFSFLVNVSDLGAKDAKAYFMALIPEVKSPGLSDGKSNNEYVKMFALPSKTTEGKYNLAFTMFADYTKTDNTRSGDLDLNTTYLVVVRLDIIEGNNNDQVSMWVNPVLTATPPAPVATRDFTNDGGSDPSLKYGGIRAIELRQGTASKNDAPVLEISGLKVGTEWSDCITAAPVTTPTLTTSVYNHRFDTAFVGIPFSFTSKISGENLEGDITFTLPADITASPSVITKEQAAEGVDVTFTVTPTAADENYEHIILINSEGAESKDIYVIGSVAELTTVANSTVLNAQLDDPDYDTKYYRYTGKAVVTAVTTETDPLSGEPTTVVYCQDMMGGMKLSSAYADFNEMGFTTDDIAVGDELTDIFFMLVDENKNAPIVYVVPIVPSLPMYTKSATGKTKTPVEVNMADYSATNAAEYRYKLVKLNNVTFTSPEGKKYTTASTEITQDATKGFAQAMANSGLLETDLPTGTVSLTGICKPTTTAMSTFTIALRNAEDVSVGAPEFSVTTENVFEGVALPIDQKTAVTKVTVVAENLPAAAPIEFGGNNPDLFSVDLTAIPAGSGTHVVTISCTPKEPGKYSANFIINTDAIDPQFNFSRKIDVKAYDPENLPEVTIEPATLSLEAAPGQTATGTVTLNSKNCFDYIQGSASEKNGVLLINNTYLLPNSTDVVLTVTFKPQAEGTFNEVWTYTTPMCSTPATLTVTGVCKGETPEEPKQGDPFEVSDKNPLVTYTQNFASVVKNEPLKIEGWTNVAVEGTRAWWGYVSTEADDSFTAAKVTAYDSKIEAADAKAVEMLLISPALNYKDAIDRMLKFRLMGQFLSEDQTSTLDVMLGIPNGTEKPDFYVMDGFNIPRKADEAGTWIPYEVDMSKVEDMPDTFFIGFRFKSKRCNAEAATYYITDFVWNPTGTGVEGIVAEGTYTVYNLQGICLLREADAAALSNLPAGLYIINGKKTMLRK